MPSNYSWLMPGAAWEEMVIDHSELKPLKTLVKYRVEGGTPEEPEIQKIEKGPDFEDEVSVSKDDLIDEGLLLAVDPEIYECVEIEGEYYFYIGPERVAVSNITREAHRLIRKYRTECDQCGGSGECPQCGNSGECQECSGTGTCCDCDGERRCTACDGTGRCYSCEGRGRNGPDICEECGGNGLCPECKGSRMCVECNGTGKCGACNGTRRCAYCNGSLKCRDCGGTGTAMMVHQKWFDTTSGLLLKGEVTSNGRKQLERALVSFRLAR